MKAVYRVLQDEGVKYSNQTDVIDDKEVSGILSQHVRTFSESLTNTQANCLDGTVLFASVLKKIGIAPIIITIPGHAFLGYYTDVEKTEIEYLETTVIGSGASFEDAQKAGLLQYVKSIKNGNMPTRIDVTKERAKIKPIPRVSSK